MRATFKKALNPTKQRTALDNERNEETARMTSEFYETFQAGIFTGWRCLYDYGRGHPTNPEALVGLPVMKDFNEHGLHRGKISHFKKPWWRVTYEDGEFEDLNFKQIANLETPPSFAQLQYAPARETSTACNDFLSTAPLKGGGISGEAVFSLAGDTWKLISVFQDAQSRMVGAYCPLPDYTDAMDGVSRSQLVLQYDTVEVALFSDIKLWIEASKKHAEVQSSACKRRRSRGSTSLLTETNLPKRPKPVLNSFKGERQSACCFCGSQHTGIEDWIECFCCERSAHQQCAAERGEDRATIAGTGRNSRSEWVCNICWVATYGEAPQ